MKGVFTGTVLENKSLYVPREPAKRLSAPYVLVQNFWYAGMNMLLLSTEQGFRNQLERLTDDNPKDPFKVLRWMCRDLDLGERVDYGFCLSGVVTPIETYISLPKRNMRLIDFGESPAYARIVSEEDCLVVLKSAEIQKYLDTRKEFYEKYQKVTEELVNSK